MTNKPKPIDLISLNTARRNFTDLINRVAVGRERIRLGHRGKALAVLVTVEDANLLEKLEDRADLAAARKALAESRGKKLIPWEQVKKRLGLR